VSTAELPTWAVCFVLLALASLLAGTVENDISGRIGRALRRRYRRSRTWRALAQRQRLSDLAPDHTTARGVDSAAYHLAPRS